MLQPGKFYELRGEFCRCVEARDKDKNLIIKLLNAKGKVIETCKVDEVVPGIRQVSRAAYHDATAPKKKVRKEKTEEDKEAEEEASSKSKHK